MSEEPRNASEWLGIYLGRLGSAVATLTEAVEILAGQPDDQARRRVAEEMQSLRASIREALTDPESLQR